MSSLLESTRSLNLIFAGKLQDFTNEIENVHMVWLNEIQQEAYRMFSSDFSTEPELMPKTPSQKKTNRRKRLSSGANEGLNKRRFSKGKRSNLRRSSVQSALNIIPELYTAQGPSASSEPAAEEPQRRTRRNNAAKTSAAEPDPVKRSARNKAAASAHSRLGEEEVEEKGAACSTQEPEMVQHSQSQEEKAQEVEESCSTPSPLAFRPPSLQKILLSEAVVLIPAPERHSAEMQLQSALSPGRSACKITIAGSVDTPSRTSVHRPLVLRRSLVALRHSMTQEAVRRASRRSFLKKKAKLGSSTCSSSVSEDLCTDIDGEETEEQMADMVAAVVAEEPEAITEDDPEVVEPEEPEGQQPEGSSTEAIRRFTRSMAQSTPTNTVPPGTVSRLEKPSTPPTSGSVVSLDDRGKKPLASQTALRPSRSGSKRQAPEAATEITTPRKKYSPPKKSQTTIRPNMKSFLHTVQKNQLLMMTPGSLSRNSVMKSFIKQATPGKVDQERERLKLEALNKKLEQENERKKKIEEDRRKKQEELKRKREERLKRVVDARVKGEQKEQEKKKKIEQKMAQMEEKNDKLRVERLAEEKAKKKVATKRQEELELRRKQEEEARMKKIQQAEEEEKRHQELMAKRRAEEEQERARKQTEARRALELKKEQDRERERERERLAAAERERERQAAVERERERQAAADRERVEREKAMALQRELERAAREKERKELEERKKALDERQRKRREEEQRRVDEDIAALQKPAAAIALPAISVQVQNTVMKTPMGKGAAFNRTIEGTALNVTVDVENTVMKTPMGKGAALNMTIEKGTALNVTVDVEQSPQSYQITPKGRKPVIMTNPEDYGMDQNSDDSTDDESAPRKPIPSWAEGLQLQQAIMKRYYDPLDLHTYFGEVEQPKLERIFHKSKPRFFKRTSSAVWHSPPRMGNLPY